MVLRTLIILVLVGLLHFTGFAQNDSISYHTNLYFLTASNSFQPHWQVSNRYGIFDRAKKTDVVGLFGLAYNYQLRKKFSLESEVEFNLRSDISTSYFQQLYVNLNYGALQLKIGKEAYTIGQYSENLSSGSFFLSNNARPIPRIGGGFYQYTPLPIIGKYVEFKGAMNFGVLNDDRSAYKGTDKPLLHEKFLYIKSKSLPINLHIGLNHSAQLGGTLYDGGSTFYDGRKIETDLVATFLAQGSAKLGGGEESNAAGAHFGLYDFGLNWNIKKTTFQFYFQKPFNDGSGRRFKSKDKILGLLFNSNKKGFISEVTYEYINTMHQSGMGISDPKIEGKTVFLREIDDLDQFMLENFDTLTAGITRRSLLDFLKEKLNYGHEFGGRDGYYDNWYYPMGLSYNHQNIGNSFLTNKATLESNNSDFDRTIDSFFVNDRIVAHHLALSGYLGNGLSHRIKMTYTNNFGTYTAANKGEGWASINDPDYYNSYYFKDGLKQAYTFLELNYASQKWVGASFTSSIAYDFGEMHHNFGLLFGFRYEGFYELGKRSN